ncbi:MAG: hypothetical protein QM729_02885 [Solirubrobacterales bacterium]
MRLSGLGLLELGFGTYSTMTYTLRGPVPHGAHRHPVLDLR